MPVESIIVVVAVVAAFAFFMVVLAYGDRTSDRNSR